MHHMHMSMSNNNLTCDAVLQHPSYFIIGTSHNRSCSSLEACASRTGRRRRAERVATKGGDLLVEVPDRLSNSTISPRIAGAKELSQLGFLTIGRTVRA